MLSSLWWGLGLALAATVAAAVALPPGRGRVPFAAAWLVVAVRLALRRPEGDYVIAADVGGYALLVGGLLLLGGALATVPPRAAAGSREDPADRPPNGPGTARRP